MKFPFHISRIKSKYASIYIHIMQIYKQIQNCQIKQYFYYNLQTEIINDKKGALLYSNQRKNSPYDQIIIIEVGTR